MPAARGRAIGGEKCEERRGSGRASRRGRGRREEHSIGPSAEGHVGEGVSVC